MVNYCRNPICIKKHSSVVPLSDSLLMNKCLIDKYEWAKELKCPKCTSIYYKCTICPKDMIRNKIMIRQELEMFSISRTYYVNYFALTDEDFFLN